MAQQYTLVHKEHYKVSLASPILTINWELRNSFSCSTQRTCAVASKRTV